MSEYNENFQFIDLAAQQKKILFNIKESINNVLQHGQYIMGPEVKSLELELKSYSGSKYVHTCANGTDAISIVLMAWGIGKNDAVFVPDFTYVASAEAPAQLGAVPFFVDVDKNTFNIDSNSLKQAIIDAKKQGLNPSVIVSVDLFGQPAKFNEIEEIAKENGLKINDSAQSFGATYFGKKTGSYGDATTTSFFPAKPLGCYGDGGAIFTQDEETADIVNSIRLHGKGSQKYDNVRIGFNSRLDTIQAAILLEKLKIFPSELKQRQNVADIYSESLDKFVKTPIVLDGLSSSWAQYTIQLENRDQVIQKLQKFKIPTVIYYPIPLSKQLGYSSFPMVSSGTEISKKLSEKVLSLPMHPYLKQSQQKIIIKSLISAL